MGNVLMEIHLLNCIIDEETDTIPGGTSCISSSTAVSTGKENRFFMRIFSKNEKNNFTKIECLCLYYLEINQINDQIKKSIVYLDNQLDFPLMMAFYPFPVLKPVAHISRGILLGKGVLGKFLVTKDSKNPLPALTTNILC